jgi:hypothetical protein
MTTCKQFTRWGRFFTRHRGADEMGLSVPAYPHEKGTSKGVWEQR